jgi:nuclear-control-of-ATPase protein 2
MSAATAKMKALKAQLSQLSATHLQSVDPSPALGSSTFVRQLSSSLARLSAPQHTSVSFDQITRLLRDLNQAKQHEPEEVLQSEYAAELEWLVLARCSVDAYACLLDQLFEQTLPLAQDIFYWDDVLSNPTWRFLFLVQSTTNHPH